MRQKHTASAYIVYPDPAQAGKHAQAPLYQKDPISSHNMHARGKAPSLYLAYALTVCVMSTIATSSLVVKLLKVSSIVDTGVSAIK
jgi:hypothetical protein